MEEIWAEGGVMAPTATRYDLFPQVTIVERVTYGAFPVVTRVKLPPQRPVREALVAFSVARGPIHFFGHNGRKGIYLERLSHSYVHRSGSLEWPVKPDCRCWDW